MSVSNALVASLSVLTVLVALMVFDPLAAVGVAGIFGTGYLLIYLTCRRMIARVGAQRMAAENLRFKIVSELFGGLREVRLASCGTPFINQFSRATDISSIASARVAVISQMPRQGLEVLGFGVIALLALYFLATGKNLTDFLPALSLYAVSAIRLLPQLQSLFSSIATIRFSVSTLNHQYPELLYTSELPLPVSCPLILEHSVEIRQLSFRYPDTDVDVLR
jgi:ABC-type bacteriocin/lantibiotic exporter with double-glycine peptidase domain